MRTFPGLRYQIRKISCWFKSIYHLFKEGENLSCKMIPRNLSSKTLFLLILISMNISASLYAQRHSIKFAHISIEEGLSQSTGNCILQDSKGFMWFGTEDGLNKYDGYSFTVYKKDLHDSTSLSDSYVMSIYEDRSGVLWVGTYNGGLNKFDREREQFTHYKYDPNNPNSLAHNYVGSIYEDKAGVLWIGTRRGLARFDRDKQQFTRFRHDPNNPKSLSHDYVSEIFEDRAGMLWIGTDGGGLDQFDREKEQFSHYKHNPRNPYSLSSNSVSSIFEDRAGLLWVGTDNGLDKFDRDLEKFVHYKHSSNNPRSLSNNFVNSVFEDSSGGLWVGTYGGGLNRFDREKGQFMHWVYEPGNPNSLGSNFIILIYEDRAGMLWVGTFGGGFNTFSREQEKFMYFRHDPTNPRSLSSSDIFSIYEDSSGVIWVGTYGGGLNRFDRKEGKFVHYRHDPNNSNSLSNNHIRSICEDKDGTLWIGTYDGLNKFDREKGKFVHYRHDPDNPSSLSNNYVRSVYEDRAGVLWVGTFGGGLSRFDREKGKFVHYRNDPDNPNSLSNDRAVSIYEDRRGMLWIGTGDGLNKFDREKGKFTQYKNDPSNPSSLSNNRIASVYEDSSGVLWVGTYGGGLNKFDREKGEFSHYMEKDGLPNDVVYGILEDNQGNLWLSTNKGISKFNPRTEKFRNYDVKDGLQSNEFNTGAYCKSKSGELFFGGINGFNVFYPEKIKDNPYVPPVVITDLKIFNKSVPIGEGDDGRLILKKSITETREIRLSYKDRVFSFDFAALNYVSPKKNEYAYMMEGFEKDWNYVGNRRFVTYTNLHPKEYIFRVKGSNNDGVWNEKGTSLRIIITPPFWHTWWFRALGIIGVLLLILMAYEVRTHSLREQSKRLEKRVEERTAELNKTNKELQQEITERKRAEEALRESEEKYRTILESIEEGYYEVDIAGNLTFFNDSLCRMLEYSKDELMGMNNRQYMDEKSAKKVYQIFNKVYKEGIPRKAVDFQIIRKDGNKKYGEISVSLIKDPSNQPVGFRGIVHDITERKQTEEKIKASLKEKEVLLKEIHHRVKNNMQIISSLLRLQSWKIKDEEILEMFKQCQNRIRSMALIHEGLYQSKDLAKIDFSDYIRSLTNHLFSLYKANAGEIDIKLDMNDVCLNINTAIPLGLIINELVSNSLKHAFPETKYYRKGGESEDEIRISLCSDDESRFTLVVGDNGVGMPKDLDFRNAGSLGLQLVNDLVKQLCGSIELERRNGTEFKIKFKGPR